MTKVFNRKTEKAKRRHLRKSMPEAEVILWSCIRNKKIAGAKFRRQYSVGKYIVDFYCAEKKLAIELDGDSHYKKGAQEKDALRQICIEQYGIRFLRFTNDEIKHNLYDVITAIECSLNDDTSCEVFQKK